mmetsp:Transcript_56415/g.134710  ORF Transcript_56415/g.134710 Transcript_56415/m.134710 type:complete len:280 (-) Transcript_56415:565-1404(-)
MSLLLSWAHSISSQLVPADTASVSAERSASMSRRPTAERKASAAAAAGSEAGVSVRDAERSNCSGTSISVTSSAGTSTSEGGGAATSTEAKVGGSVGVESTSTSVGTACGSEISASLVLDGAGESGMAFTVAKAEVADIEACAFWSGMGAGSGPLFIPRARAASSESSNSTTSGVLGRNVGVAGAGLSVSGRWRPGLASGVEDWARPKFGVFGSACKWRRIPSGSSRSIGRCTSGGGRCIKGWSCETCGSFLSFFSSGFWYSRFGKRRSSSTGPKSCAG